MTEELCITTAAQLYHFEEDLIFSEEIGRGYNPLVSTLRNG